MKKSICITIIMVILTAAVLPVSAVSAFQNITAVTQNILTFDIATSNVTINAPDDVGPDFDFTATVDIDYVTELNAAQYDILFDSSVIRLDGISNGLISGTQIPASSNIVSSGHCRIINSLGTSNISGTGYLSVLNFHVIGNISNQSAISFSDGLLSSISGTQITADWTNDLVTVVDIKKGDANGDGSVNVLDITRVARIILLLEPSTTAADVDTDGQVNILDMVEIAKIILSQVSVTPQAWTEQTMPGTGSHQLAPDTDVSFVTIAPNGDIFAVDTAGATDIIYKSINGGVNWTATVPATPASAPWGTGNIVAMVVSPAYVFDSTVLVLANVPNGASSISRVYISTNGGASFSILGGAILGLGTSMAVAPNYVAGTGEIMVGTTDTDGTGGAYGGVYIWNKNGVLDWKNSVVLNADVTSVAYSPYYQVDGTRIAVGSTAATGTCLHTLVANDISWDNAIGNAAVISENIHDTGSANATTGSFIAVPSDFNSTTLFARSVYVATNNDGTDDNVYRQSIGSINAPVALDPLAPYLTVTDQEVTSLAYSGTESSGTLYAGAGIVTGPDIDSATVVYTTGAPSATASTPPTWSPPMTVPTGGGIAGLVSAPCVALANDFAASQTVYVGTSGTDSALSVSTDGGINFRQVGLIDTTIADITDFQAPSGTDFYLATNNGAGQTSIWRTEDGGVNWYRVFSLAIANGIIRLSPAYATDSTIVVGGVNTSIIKVSNTKGDNWNILVSASPLTIADIAVSDEYTLYIGSATSPQVAMSLNGGYYFSPVPTTVSGMSGNILSLNVDPETGNVIAVSSLGEIAVSRDGNSSWTMLPSLPVTSNMVEITFSGLDDGDYIYAVAAPGTSIYRLYIGVSSSWINITPAGLTPVYDIFGLALNEESLFALGTDGTDSVCWWTSEQLGTSPTWNSLVTSGVVINHTPHTLKTIEGRLWAVDTLSNRVYFSELK